MIQLQLALLGPFQASWRGEPLSGFRSDKARALLAYLALAGEEPQPRAHLAALLWGEKGEAAARGSLRAALSNLRRILSPLKDEGRSPLKTTRHAVSWQPDERVWLDTAVLDTLLRQCRAHPHDYVAHCPACLPRLRQAVALYRGDFLVGLSLGGSPVFTEWQRIQQETWHQRVLSTLETLTGAYLQAGDWDAAVHYARRQLALVPWLEPAHRQLMRALAWRGEEAAALAQYHACRRILAEELEVEPEARTTALYQQIRDGRLPAAAPVSAPLRNNLPAAVTPFIGRKTEMDALCQQLSDPDYRLISLTGEGGVGKTRLALAAARQVLSHFPDGVWFIPLADTTAANNAEAALTTAITAVLGLAAAPPSASQLPAVLRQKQMLLILDNLEGLLAAASSAVIPFLLHLIRHAPGVSLLVTSRALLNVQAEWSLRLDGLPVPAAGETAIEEYASVRLFVERAGRISGGFRMTAQNRPHVADICRLSDGLPLAIELAAAWTSHYTCAEIARSMRQNLGFLASNLPDLPPRHRSIYAVMEHSWALLAPAEREAYRNLAVFQGSFTRAAAAE
ncbi:MAG: BTAD domain-containing putative transcriptional regulator, partial [Anaerolineae bacterium]